MPYNLAVNEDIRSYLDNLDPSDGRNEKEMNDYLYSLSEQVEPRNSKKPPVFVSIMYNMIYDITFIIIKQNPFRLRSVYNAIK